jgi:glycosyltransferase involved in cell wall biosynthesis/SAM-dependent methyltransferase
MPPETELQALYADPEYFLGGTEVGYQDYDRQARPNSAWFLRELDQLGGETPDPVLLDVGCAFGPYLGAAASRNWKVYGVETSTYALEVATKRLPPKTCLVPTITALPPLQPDLILLLDLLEHHPDPLGLLASLAERDLLTPRTVLLATTPNARSEEALANPARWRYLHPPAHLIFFSASSLRRLLETVGFTEVEVTGLYPQPSWPGEAVPHEDEEESDTLPWRGHGGLLVRASGYGAPDARDLRLLALRHRMRVQGGELEEQRKETQGLRQELRQVLTERERLIHAPSFHIYSQLPATSAPLARLGASLLRLAGGITLSFLALPQNLREAWETSGVPVRPKESAPWRLFHPPGRLLRQCTRLLSPRHRITRYQAPTPLGGSRPRILHALAKVSVGGSTQLVMHLLQGLHPEFHQEVLIGSQETGVDCIGVPLHFHPRPASLDALRWKLREGSFDLLHLHDNGSEDRPWYQVVLAAAEAESIPVLLNLNTPTQPSQSPAVCATVFVSDWLRRNWNLPETCRPREIEKVLYPGMEGEFFRPLAQEDPRATPPEDVVGMVYRLEPDKLDPEALDGLLELVKRRPRTQVVILGRGSLLPHFLERARQAGLREHFEFAGAVPHQELPDWYRRFTLFVAPVARESFGEVVPFAMASGLPVVGYRVGALPEILGGEETLRDSPQELALLMDRLLADPVRRRQLGESNRQRAKAYFQVDSMVLGYQGLYRHLLNRSH